MELKNISAPNLEGKSTEQKFHAMMEYMEQFKQYLTHTLQNLDTNNMTQEVATVIQQAVDNTNGMNTYVSQGQFTSAIKQMADKIALMVTKNGVVGAINLSAEEAKIAFEKIILEGYTTINGGFKVDTAGNMEAISGQVGGFTLYNNKLEAAPSGKPVLTLDAANSKILLGIAAMSYASMAFKIDIGTVTGESNSAFVIHGGNGTGNERFIVQDGAAWFNGNVSAASYTDRTPSYEGDALEELALVANDANGDIDHATLPVAARKKVKRKKTVRGKSKEVEEEGRDLGMMISILTKGIQQLTQRTAGQQKKIEALENAEKQREASTWQPPQ